MADTIENATPGIDTFKRLDAVLRYNWYPFKYVLTLGLVMLISLVVGIYFFANDSGMLGVGFLCITFAAMIGIKMILGPGPIEIKPSDPAQRGVPEEIDKYLEVVLPPGVYWQVPFKIYSIKVVDVAPDDFNVVVPEVYCRPTDHPNASTISSEELTNLKLETGGGRISGTIAMTVTPDFRKANRFILFIQNARHHEDGSLEFAKERLTQTVNRAMDELGKIYSWQSLVGSPDMLAFLLIKKVCGLTPENLLERMPELLDNTSNEGKGSEEYQLLFKAGVNIQNIRGRITPVLFERIMGVVGFPDGNGLGVRIYKITDDLSPETLIRDLDSANAAQALKRKAAQDQHEYIVGLAQELIEMSKVDEKPTMTLQEAMQLVQVDLDLAQSYILGGDSNAAAMLRVGGKKKTT